ncbi:MAG: HAMP domain-containing sensor histidine kinase [Treponemataceae bacterium]
MRFVKRFWAPLLAAGLIPLLITLAFFQLTWISEMGERERFRLTQGLYAAAGQLSYALENELGVLPAVFGLGKEDVEESIRSNEWTDFKKRWAIWKSYAIVPSFVAGFHIVRTARLRQKTEVRYWDGDHFSIDSTPGLAAALNAAIEKIQRGRIFMEPANLDDGTEAFLLPADWQGNYWLAIRIDRKILTEKLIPLIAERYLLAQNEYIYRIVDMKEKKTVYLSDSKANPSVFDQKDVSIPLVSSDFRVSPTDDGPPQLRSIGTETGIALMKERKSGAEMREKFGAKTEGFRLRPPKPEGSDRVRWTFEAVHRKGSLAAAVRMETVRSAAVSSGILFILAIVLLILATAVRRTQELADRRREFIATVTHELKTPVAVIRSAAENLADGVVKDLEKTAKYGNVIRRESGKLTDMIDSLLVYARVGDGAPRKHDVVDFGSLVLRAMESRQEELIAANFTVDADISEGVRVKGDPAALELVVGNLISNTLKHAAEGAFLGIRVSTEDTKINPERTPKRWAVLTIRDRGPGIIRKERRLVFDPFYRGQYARERQTPGSGLGLNLVSRIVAAHGGTVSLDTQAERGSTFVIRLPLEDLAYA